MKWLNILYNVMSYTASIRRKYAGLLRSKDTLQCEAAAVLSSVWSWRNACVLLSAGSSGQLAKSSPEATLQLVACRHFPPLSLPCLPSCFLSERHDLVVGGVKKGFSLQN